MKNEVFIAFIRFLLGMSILKNILSEKLEYFQNTKLQILKILIYDLNVLNLVDFDSLSTGKWTMMVTFC